MTSIANFRTPPRILIPKLVRSRDAWKAKATSRKTQRKALEIRVRDLEVSREHHRQRAEMLQTKVEQLQRQLADLRNSAPVPPNNAPVPQNNAQLPQKLSTNRVVDNTRSLSSGSH